MRLLYEGIINACAHTYHLWASAGQALARKFVQLSFRRCLINLKIYPPVAMLMSDTRRVEWDIASRQNQFFTFAQNRVIFAKKWKIDSDGSRYLIRRVSCHWSTLLPADKFESSLNSDKTRVEWTYARARRALIGQNFTHPLIFLVLKRRNSTDSNWFSAFW